MRDKAPDLGRDRGVVEQGGILQPAHDPVQSPACLPVLAVPEQVPQSLEGVSKTWGRPLAGPGLIALAEA
jgi:hypothetical protein